MGWGHSTRAVVLALSLLLPGEDIGTTRLCREAAGMAGHRVLGTAPLPSPWSRSLAVPGGIQAEQQRGHPQPHEAGPSRVKAGPLGRRPRSLPGCAASPGNDSVAAPRKSFPGPGNDQLYFRCRAGRCPIWPREGRRWGQVGAASAPGALPLPPSSSPAAGPCWEQHVRTGSSRFTLGAVGLCWAVPFVPVPAQRWGTGRDAEAPQSRDGLMPRLPRRTISGSPRVLGRCTRSRQRLLLARPALFGLVNTPILSPRRASSRSFITVTRETAPCCQHSPGQGEALEQV